MRNRPHRIHSSQIGFTLIELLVTIAVMVIVSTWAVPSYQQFIARNEVAAEVMRIRTALAIARNTAITRRTTVTICPSADLTSCTTSEGWLDSLVIFEGDGEAGDTLLRNLGESRIIGLTYRNDNRPVRYRALGRASGYNGTFRICGQLDSGARVIVSNLGRVRTESERPQC